MAAVPELNDQPFRFMDMAPELRDLVYDEMYQENGLRPLRNRFIIKDAPIASLLRVSQQFSAEYADRIRHHTAWVLTDGLYTPPDPSSISALLIGSIKAIEKGRIRFLSLHTNGTRFGESDISRQELARVMSSHLKWLQALHVPDLEIEILQECEDWRDHWVVIKSHPLYPMLQSWVDLGKIRKIRMLRGEGTGLGFDRYDQRATLATEYATWTNAGGWKAHEMVEESEPGLGEADENEADERETDESEPDERKADERKADERKADESEANESEANENDTDDIT